MTFRKLNINECSLLEIVLVSFSTKNYLNVKKKYCLITAELWFQVENCQGLRDFMLVIVFVFSVFTQVVKR